MYIGPWQEYALSRVKPKRDLGEQQDGGAVRDLESIRQALLAALSPEEAQRALQSLQPLLGKSSEQGGLALNSDPRKALPQLRIPAPSSSLPPSERNNYVGLGQSVHSGRGAAGGGGSSGMGMSGTYRGNAVTYKQYGKQGAEAPAPFQPSNQSQRQGRHLRKIQHSLLNPGIYKLSNDADTIDDESFCDTPTPMSVRSTMSEPIQSSGFRSNKTTPSASPYSQQQQQQQQPPPQYAAQQTLLPSLGGHNNNLSNMRRQQKIDEEAMRMRQESLAIEQHLRFELEHQQLQQPQTKQPPYNATAMLSLLKLERASRPPKPNFGKYWGWKGDDEISTVSSKGESTGTNDKDTTKSKTEKEVAEKISRVKKMQQLYATRAQGDALASTTAVTTSTSVSLTSPIRVPLSHSNSRRVPSPPNMTGPRISDMDITESELLLVSKYFNSSASETPPPDANSQYHQSQLQLDPHALSPPPLSGLSPASPKYSASVSANAAQDANFTSPSPSSRQKMSSAGGDELYSGSLDGLLKWSSMLSDD
jgi:hypothetical protein